MGRQKTGDRPPPAGADEAARRLAEWHTDADGGIVRIVRIDAEDDRVILLEVNRETPPAGIVPIEFGPSPSFPFSSIIIEVSVDEFNRIESGQLELPDGWARGETLFRAE